jgi:hypothetical protein
MAYTWQSVPRALFELAAEVQRRAAPGDIVQAAHVEQYWFAVLCDRQPYVGGPFFFPHPVQTARQQEVTELNQRLNGAAARRFFAARHIAWYVLWPGEQPPWAAELAANLVLTRDGFRLYHVGKKQDE